jgi:hypothetical protein
LKDRISEQHPLFCIKEAFDYSDITHYEYSVYKSGGHGVTLSRFINRIEKATLTSNWLAAQINKLEPGEELAWHSTVYCGEKKCHIPMIDFVTTDSKEECIAAVNKLSMGKVCEPYFFSSGRSVHCYFSCILDRNEWIEYMGKLLLLNPFNPNEPYIVDTRWVGHSIVNGFSALRWTSNSKFYLKMPEAV